MITLFTVIHIIVCLMLILIVLLQSGSSADLAGAFGGAGSQTAFGPRGAATFLTKATTIAAIVFMFTSTILALYASRPRATSVLEKAPKSAPTAPAPVQPAAPTGGTPTK